MKDRFKKLEDGDMEKLGSAPILFVDETKRQEWLDLDPSIRRETVSMLHECAKRMETSVVLDVMANVLKDFEERLIALEEKNHDRD